MNEKPLPTNFYCITVASKQIDRRLIHQETVRIGLYYSNIQRNNCMFINLRVSCALCNNKILQ
jgi:hypothetical protein